MSFISLPHSFGDAQAKASAFQIARVGASGLEPVGMLHLEESLPIEAEKLAANLAALLNGNNPLYRFGGTAQMYYHKIGTGRMAFTFRKGEDAGVSVTGATIIMLSGLENLLDDAANPESSAFKNFLDAGNKEERRSAPRTEASGGKKHTPKSGAVPNPPSF